MCPFRVGAEDANTLTNQYSHYKNANIITVEFRSKSFSKPRNSPLITMQDVKICREEQDGGWTSNKQHVDTEYIQNPEYV